MARIYLGIIKAKHINHLLRLMKWSRKFCIFECIINNSKIIVIVLLVIPHKHFIWYNLNRKDNFEYFWNPTYNCWIQSLRNSSYSSEDPSYANLEHPSNTSKSTSCCYSSQIHHLSYPSLNFHFCNGMILSFVSLDFILSYVSHVKSKLCNFLESAFKSSGQTQHHLFSIYYSDI